MKYEKVKEKHILGKWLYQAQYSFHFDWVIDPNGKKVEKWQNKEDQEIIENIEQWLNTKAEGKWRRIGNNFYLEKLSDIFSIRLYFDEGLKFIKEATR